MPSIEERVRQVGEGRRILMETESKAILEEWGVPIVPCEVATSREEALNLSRTIGFPVVLKILSPDIVHKSQAGGVRVGLIADDDVISAFDEIMENVRRRPASASVLGVTVQRMVSGLEVAIGVTTDSQFGHVLMFGLGGVDVELMRDTTFRLIPIDAVDADEMIRDIKGFPLLMGHTGGNLEDLRSMLLKVSDLIVSHPRIEGMDLNPVIVSRQGSVVADARIVLGE